MMFYKKIILLISLSILFIKAEAQIIIHATINCAGIASNFQLSNTNNIDSVKWIFFGNVNDTITSLNANEIFTNAGNKNVTVYYFITGNSFQIDSVFSVPGVPQVYLYDLNACEQIFSYNLNNIATTYLWSTGETTSQITSSSPGIYWVNATNACGTATDTGVIIFSYAPVDNFPENITLCEGAIDTLIAGPTTGQFSWQDGSNLNYFVVSTPNQYSVYEVNQCGALIEYINVNYVAPPTINFIDDTLFCQNFSVVLQAYAPGGSVHWNDNTFNNSKTIHLPGYYYVTASNVCMTISDSVHITKQQAPQVEIGSDTLLCGGNKLSFALNDYGGEVIWNDSSTNPYHDVYPNFDSTFTKISVKITNGCGVAADSFRLRSSYISLHLPADTLLCEHDVFPIDVFVNDSTTIYQWSDGSSEHYKELSSPGNYYVTVSNQCGSRSDNIIITNFDCINCAKLPDAFSPNGDGMNDIFRPISACNIIFYHMKIFNRWGEEVYSSYSIEHIGWDGNYNLQPQPVGSYVYILNYEWYDGNSKLSNTKSGSVTLVR